MKIKTDRSNRHIYGILALKNLLYSLFAALTPLLSQSCEYTICFDLNIKFPCENTPRCLSNEHIAMVLRDLIGVDSGDNKTQCK